MTNIAPTSICPEGYIVVALVTFFVLGVLVAMYMADTTKGDITSNSEHDDDEDN